MSVLSDGLFFDDKQRMFVSGQAFALTDGISAKSLVFSQESAIAEFDGGPGGILKN